jgi:hypothetical protein
MILTPISIPHRDVTSIQGEAQYRKLGIFQSSCKKSFVPSATDRALDENKDRSPYRRTAIALSLVYQSMYLRRMTYPPTPSTFEDVIQLIPPRDKISKYRFSLSDKLFEIQIGRTSMNIVWLTFCVPDPRWEFWPNVRTVESLTTQRAVWAYWQQFLENPDMYLTSKYIGGSIVYPEFK